jgi:methyl-accepting chemotaxis protein
MTQIPPIRRCQASTRHTRPASGSREKAQGVEQIGNSMGRMHKVTQKNAANAEESAAASEELSAQAQQMRGCVRELAELVGRTDQTRKAA